MITRMVTLKIVVSKMEFCNLCKNKYDKMFKPEEQLLGTQLSNVIKSIYSDYEVKFPPKFLICTACAAAILQAEIILKRLTKALPDLKSCQNGASLDVVKDESNESDEDNEDFDISKKEVPVKEITVLKKPTTGWTFQCTLCEFSTENGKVYKKHLISKHQLDNPRIYKCTFCDQTYQRVDAIQKHITSIHENKTRPKPQRRQTIAFDTPSLLSSTTIKSQLEIEIDKSDPITTRDYCTSNSGNLPYELDCELCKYKTVKPKLFKKHLQTKHQVEDARIYKCKSCPSTYAREFALLNHIAYKHENKPRPKPQRRKSEELDLDLNSTGGKESKIPVTKGEKGKVMNQKCDISNKIDDEKSQKEEHVIRDPLKRKSNKLNSNEISQSEWVFECTYCGFETEKKMLYKVHLNNEHDIYDRDIYKCRYCSASYERYSLLHGHITNKHNNHLTIVNDTSSLYTDSSQDQKKLYSAKKQKIKETQQNQACTACGKNYLTVEKLRTHMDKHHGGENCSNCDAQFRSTEKYNATMLNEECTDTKIACQYPGCPKRCSRPKKMQKHMREYHPDFNSLI